MRLINVRTFEMSMHIGDKKPPYAILSHTWGDEEVTYHDMSRIDTDGARVCGMKGFRKIEFTCRQAEKDGFDWAWVDTCCIDKSSSAELTEAINSMWNWYKHSEICYIFLEDLKDAKPHPDTDWAAVAKCRWFTRGWTLQELIAPRKRMFFDGDWTPFAPLDAKDERNERDSDESESDEDDRDEIEWPRLKEIAKIAGIPWYYLVPGEGGQEVRKCSVAKRMSWAAGRECKRIEDRAYSLFGLFDINMPLIYGEGKKAFIRLQEEIIKESDDDSIFCWTVPSDDPRALTLGSILAESPDDFKEAGGITKLPKFSREALSMTNRGLRFPETRGRSVNYRTKHLLGIHQLHGDLLTIIPLDSGLYPRLPTEKGPRRFDVGIVCLREQDDLGVICRLVTSGHVTTDIDFKDMARPPSAEHVRKWAKPEKITGLPALATLTVNFRQPDKSIERVSLGTKWTGPGWSLERLKSATVADDRAYFLEYEQPGNVTFVGFYIMISRDGIPIHPGKEPLDMTRGDLLRFVLLCGFKVSNGSDPRPISACCLLMPFPPENQEFHIGMFEVYLDKTWFREQYASCSAAWAACPDSEDVQRRTNKRSRLDVGSDDGSDSLSHHGSKRARKGAGEVNDEPMDSGERASDREEEPDNNEEETTGSGNTAPAPQHFVTSCQVRDAQGNPVATACLKIELRQDLAPRPSGGLLHRYHLSVDREADPGLEIDTTVSVSGSESGEPLTIRRGGCQWQTSSDYHYYWNVDLADKPKSLMLSDEM